MPKPDVLLRLEAAVEDRVRLGRCGSMSEPSVLRQQVGYLRAVAATRRSGFFDVNTGNVFVRPLRCGDEEGVFVGVLGGNFKASSATYSAATAIVAIDEALAPIASRAGAEASLDRLCAQLHEQLSALNRHRLPIPAMPGLGGQAQELTVSVCVCDLAFVLRDRAFVAHVGEAGTFLLRDGRLDEKTVAHLLGNDPAFQERVKSNPDMAIHAGIVVRGLGFSRRPEVDLHEVELEPGDRLVVANMGVSAALRAASPSTLARPAAELLDELADAALESQPALPANAVVVDCSPTGSPYR